MFRAIAIATAMLAVPALRALSQPNSSQPPSHGAAAAEVLGPTGTMYDGNNTRLRLPPEQNTWYEDAWAGYPPSQASVEGGSGAATGPGAARASIGTKTGGEH
jgi:hypothetical protein